MKDIIKKRHSVRNFVPTKIEGLDTLIELAKCAPSAGGVRGYKVFSYTEEDIRKFVTLTGFCKQTKNMGDVINKKFELQFLLQLMDMEGLCKTNGK